ncbi:MAG: aminotransferase class V-fold PLP-dependent enzyme [Intestinibacter sp.]|uniref:aminotransferase class V-fold PLP-dependent enzyme n=1 Tax=Intestinibacter sp. TaxID=1965304 RepID=UPI003F15F886
MDIKKFERERENIPLSKKYCYFDTASTGPIPNYVYEGVKKFQDDRYLVGGDCDWDGKNTSEMIEWAKDLLGKMINCDGEDIAFGQNSSQMFNLFSHNIKLDKGDNVILMDNTFISGKFAWQLEKNRGIELRYVKNQNGEIKIQDIFKLVDKNTKVISISFVESSSGFKHNVKEIGEFCNKNNIYLVVDAVQALGVLQVDVKKMNIDFLVGNDYKWMMNYCGSGFAYVSKKIRKDLQQWGAGWMSDNERYNTNKKELILRADAGRYEFGYLNVSSVYGLGLVASHYLELGKENIENYVMSLVDYLYSEVEKIPSLKIYNPYNKENRSSIVNICFPKKLKITSQTLLENGVFASVQEKEELKYDSICRISIHYFNNKNDIDTLLNTIKKEIKKCQI